jgi:hypothetical protein
MSVRVPRVREGPGNQRARPQKADHSKTPYGIWKKSDRLLEFLLKGVMPEVYRDRVEHRGQVVQHKHKFVGSMTELLALYRDLAAKEANDDDE